MAPSLLSIPTPVIGTVEANLNKRLMIYLNYGGDYVGRRYFGVKGEGYGSPYVTMTGCNTESTPSGPNASSAPTAPSNCGGNNKDVQEFSAGEWYNIYNGPKGRLRFGLQYARFERDLWSGVGGPANPDGGAKGVDNMFWTSLALLRSVVQTHLKSKRTRLGGSFSFICVRPAAHPTLPHLAALISEEISKWREGKKQTQEQQQHRCHDKRLRMQCFPSPAPIQNRPNHEPHQHRARRYAGQRTRRPVEDHQSSEARNVIGHHGDDSESKATTACGQNRRRARPVRHLFRNCPLCIHRSAPCISRIVAPPCTGAWSSISAPKNPATPAAHSETHTNPSTAFRRVVSFFSCRP